MGRLDKRLRAHGMRSHADYFALFGKPGYEDETTAAIDLLTTNETYFFENPNIFNISKDDFGSLRKAVINTCLERRQFERRRSLHHCHDLG